MIFKKLLPVYIFITFIFALGASLMLLPETSFAGGKGEQRYDSQSRSDAWRERRERRRLLRQQRRRASSPFADDAPYIYYVSGNLGYSLPADGNAQTEAFDNAFLFGVAVGTHFFDYRGDYLPEGRFRVEASLDMRYNDGDPSRGTPPTDDYTDLAITLLGNIYYDFHTDNGNMFGMGDLLMGAKPYVGLGMGPLFFSEDRNNPPAGIKDSGSDYAFAVAFHVGARYDVTERVGVSFGYGYLLVPEKINLKSFAAPDNEREASLHDLRFGVYYRY